jgi:elongation factor G
LIHSDISSKFVLEGKDMSTVMMDITNQRRGQVTEIVDAPGNEKILVAQIPLKSMVGYSTILRSLTQGRGTFSMEFDCYGDLSETEEANVRENMRGGP